MISIIISMTTLCNFNIYLMFSLTNKLQLKLIVAGLLFVLTPLLAQDEATLINITTLAQLDAMRHDLDGDGTPSGSDAEQAAYRAAFGLGTGANNTCTGGCTGYELMSEP